MPELAFYMVDMSRVLEEHIGDAILVALRKLIKHEMQVPGN
jgi:hypothetical protein